MTLDLDAAQRLAADYVRSIRDPAGPPVSLDRDDFIERPFGWLFVYDVDPTRSEDLIAGNGPSLVDRRTAKLYVCGSAHPAEWYVDACERAFG